MKYKCCLIISLFFLIACEDSLSDFFVKDKHFSMSTTPYTGDELKINGYYYKKYNNERSLVVIFYENGVRFGGSGMAILNIEIENKLSNSDYTKSLRDCRACWGPFEINSNNLKFEFYDFMNNYWHTYIAHCEILNDTTFNVKKVTFSKTGEEVKNNEYPSSSLLGEFHFRQSSPKPDSINNFVP